MTAHDLPALDYDMLINSKGVLLSLMTGLPTQTSLECTLFKGLSRHPSGIEYAIFSYDDEHMLENYSWSWVVRYAIE